VFDLGGGDPVTGDVLTSSTRPKEPEIAVIVFLGAVAGK